MSAYLSHARLAFPPSTPPHAFPPHRPRTPHTRTLLISIFCSPQQLYNFVHEQGLRHTTTGKPDETGKSRLGNSTQSHRNLHVSTREAGLQIRVAAVANLAPDVKTSILRYSPNLSPPLDSTSGEEDHMDMNSSSNRLFVGQILVRTI